MKDYILEKIKLFRSGIINIDELTDKLCEKVSEINGESQNDELRKKIYDIVKAFNDKKINDDELVGIFNDYLIVNNNNVNRNNSVNKSDSKQVSNNTSNTQKLSGISTPVVINSNDKGNIVDVDTDIILEVASKYANVKDNVVEAKIDIPIGVQEFSSDIINTVNEANDDISSLLDESKEAMVEILSQLDYLDNEIKDINIDEFDFNSIWNLVNDIKASHTLVEADKNFFLQNADCKVDGDVVTFIKEGRTYQYNLSSKKLTIDGSLSVNVGIYIPQGVKDYSKVNTLTYFVGNEYDKITQYPSDATVLRFLKSDTGIKHFTKQNEVPLATKFINGVVNTDFEKCQNIVAGDSLYGAESLKLAANNGDLYQTVYCVNNAVLVSGENALKGEKVQFTSFDELKGLDGKNVYFISAMKDDNLNRCANRASGWVECSCRKGYLYTGLDLVSKTCPNANIYMIYNNKGKDELKNLLYDFQESHDNFTYLDDKWNDFARKDYSSHTDGNRIMSELVEASVTNFNGYTV